jgi:acetylornithine/succinyldiaminopimelate/putrescine aminotransferase
VHLSNLFRHPYTEQVATRLCTLTDMAAAFFTNSGTEAIECALKLARKAMHVRGTRSARRSWRSKAASTAARWARCR